MLSFAAPRRCGAAGVDGLAVVAGKLVISDEAIPALEIGRPHQLAAGRPAIRAHDQRCDPCVQSERQNASDQRRQHKPDREGSASGPAQQLELSVLCPRLTDDP